MLYRIEKTKAVEWVGQPINNVLYPLTIESLWSNEVLNALGLYHAEPADEVPAGKRIKSSSVKIVNGYPKWVNVLEDIPETPVEDYILTARQFKLGLVRSNISLALVQSSIDAIPNDTDRDETQLHWQYSTRFEWTNSLTQTILSVVGLDEANAKIMWETARTYEL